MADDGYGTGVKCLKFYENWFEMARTRDTDEKRLAFYDAIMNYAFRGIVPPRPVKGESKGPVWAAWDGYNAAKPVIDGFMEREVRSERARISGLARGTGSGRVTVMLPTGSSIPEEVACPTAQTGAREVAGSVAETSVETVAETSACPTAETSVAQATEQAPVQADTLFPLKDNDKDKENDKDNENDTSRKKWQPYVETDDIGVMFEAWWKDYPSFRRYDKKGCRKKFRAILEKSGDPVRQFNILSDALREWRASYEWTHDGGIYVCNSYKWFVREKWNDHPESEEAVEARIGASRGKGVANILPVTSAGADGGAENAF